MNKRVPKRRRSESDADYMKRYRREQSRHWPTDGDISFWQLVKTVLFGWMKRG